MKTFLKIFVCLLMMVLNGCSFIKNTKQSDMLGINEQQEKILIKKMELKNAWHDFLVEGGKIVTKD